MCPIKFELLTFDHVVEFNKDHTVFAAARENGNGHLRLFLIYERTGNVYTRNGTVDSWEQLSDADRDIVLRRLISVRNSIPTYKINGSTSPVHDELTTGGSHN